MPYETYFEKANNNNPIRSSIPAFIKNANERSLDAQNSARQARNAVFYLAGFGGVGLVAAAVTIFITLHSYFQQINANIIAVDTLASSVATQAASDAKKAEEEVSELKGQSNRSNDAIQQGRTQLDQARADIESLKTNVRQLTEQLRTRSPSRRR